MKKMGLGGARYVGSTRLITRGHAQPWNTTSNVSKQCGTKREGGHLVLRTRELWLHQYMEAWWGGGTLIRPGTRQKLMASPCDAEFEDETESSDEIDVEESAYCTEDDE